MTKYSIRKINGNSLEDGFGNKATANKAFRAKAKTVSSLRFLYNFEFVLRV